MPFRQPSSCAPSNAVEYVVVDVQPADLEKAKTYVLPIVYLLASEALTFAVYLAHHYGTGAVHASLVLSMLAVTVEVGLFPLRAFHYIPMLWTWFFWVASNSVVLSGARQEETDPLYAASAHPIAYTLSIAVFVGCSWLTLAKPVRRKAFVVPLVVTLFFAAAAFPRPVYRPAAAAGSLGEAVGSFPWVPYLQNFAYVVLYFMSNSYVERFGARDYRNCEPIVKCVQSAWCLAVCEWFIIVAVFALQAAYYLRAFVAEPEKVCGITQPLAATTSGAHASALYHNFRVLPPEFAKKTDAWRVVSEEDAPRAVSPRPYDSSLSPSAAPLPAQGGQRPLAPAQEHGALVLFHGGPQEGETHRIQQQQQQQHGHGETAYPRADAYPYSYRRPAHDAGWGGAKAHPVHMPLVPHHSQTYRGPGPAGQAPTVRHREPSPRGAHNGAALSQLQDAPQRRQAGECTVPYLPHSHRQPTDRYEDDDSTGGDDDRQNSEHERDDPPDEEERGSESEDSSSSDYGDRRAFPRARPLLLTD